MKDLIALLKQNEKPFGLMSEEMRGKAIEIGPNEFEFYNNDRKWKPFPIDDFYYASVSRLRADYTPPAEDEYVTCEIYTKGSSLCFEDLSGSGWMLEVAPRFSNFAGYLVNDQLFGRLYKHKETGTLATSISYVMLDTYEVCDMDGAKVVFKKGNSDASAT